MAAIQYSGADSAEENTSTPTGLVAREGLTQLRQRRTGPHQRGAATGDDALLDRGLGRRDRVLDALLALLERRLGGGADLDHGDATGQLGQPLLELLAVPVGIGRLDLRPQLGLACLDGLLRAAAVDDDRVVLADHDASRRTQHVEADLTQQQTDVGVDHLAAGHHRQILEERLAAITEERRLDRDGLVASCEWR